MDERVQKKLASLRLKIDHSDRKILEALGHRFQSVRKIDALKKAAGISPLQKSRWKTVVRERVLHAKTLGLSPAFVKALLELVHGESLRLQSSAAKRVTRKKS